MKTRKTIKYFKGCYDGLYHVHEPLNYMLCTNHTGKMINMISISSSALVNPYCLARAKNNTICRKCYAIRQLNRQANTRYKYKKCSYNLSQRELTDTEIKACKKAFKNTDYIRLEFLGDLINELHLKNYIKVINAYPDKHFTLWTKNLFILNPVLDEIGKPKNLKVVYSNPDINKPIELDCDKKYRHCDKVFNVCDSTYYNEHQTVKFNCPKQCFNCLKCYNPNNTTVVINELLK